jgi:GNAT superfamily N-acetyltransferase
MVENVSSQARAPARASLRNFGSTRDEHDQPAVFGASYLTGRSLVGQIWPTDGLESAPYAVRVPLVRQALESDVDRIHSLILELATYERSADQVKATPDQLRAALFGTQPAAYALVAESGDEVVGFALYFRNFSTWEGVHGIYLEDLYVKPEHRGAGHGKALLRSLAALAVERGYARLEWAVLNWNQPSIDFYRSLGAVPLDEWIVYRLSGDPLLQVAQQALDSHA